VNNFSALSAKLTDELNEALKSATLSDKIRVEVDELTDLLKDNLSGEHRPDDINALLDERLSLA
jgi:two-component system, NtrC family, sensor kinase